MRTPLADLTVVILCGGKGDRLKPLTNTTPKPLVEIKGTPILSHMFNYFESVSIKKYVVAVGYMAEDFRNYFKKKHTNSEVQIVDSGDVDIIQRIKDAAHLIKNDFILCYGDTLADVNLNELAQYHDSHNGDISVTSYPLQSQFGLLELDANGLVTSFKEKPVLDKWINIGYMYISAKCKPELDKYSRFVDFLQAMVQQNRLYSFKHNGIHITVNTLQELQEAEQNIGRFTKTFGA